MKKILLLLVIAVSITSCTIQDIINFINKQDSSYSKEDYSEQSISRDSIPSSLLLQNNPTDPLIEGDLEEEKDRGIGRP